MALIAARLKAGVFLVVIISLFPRLYTPSSPLLPVPNKPCGFCGCLLTIFFWVHNLHLALSTPAPAQNEMIFKIEKIRIMLPYDESLDKGKGFVPDRINTQGS